MCKMDRSFCHQMTDSGRLEGFCHFSPATYLHAYDIQKMEMSELAERLERMIQYTGIHKVYIENHRGAVDISVEKLQEIKHLFEERGVATAGGITYTVNLNGIRKPAIFDTFCYTDPAHRKEALRIACELASVFDEIILDDFFFTACRCEMCITAKGSRSWKEYRLSLMEEFSKELVREVKKVNPELKFVIKFPNWFESYAELGYYPEKQKDLFDGIYTGTETRTPFDAQHLQRYESYSIIRMMEHTAPSRNGGGWVDLFGSLECTENLVEQLEATLLGGAKEIMLWNMGMYSDFPDLPKVGEFFKEVDQTMDQLGKPIGLSVYNPFNSDAEEQIYNYLGMRGAALEPTPYFEDTEKMIFFPAAAAEDKNSLEKLKAFVLRGGTAIVTVGYYRQMYEKGIQDLSSVTCTNRHVSGNRYRIQNANYYNQVDLVEGAEKILFEVLAYKTNATHCDISVMDGACNFPVLTEDQYGKGRFFILNLPENYANYYELPREVNRTINKHLSGGIYVYAGGSSEYALYIYDNETFILRSYSQEAQLIDLVIRGEHQNLRNLTTGHQLDNSLKLPKPNCMMDGVTVIEEPQEYLYQFTLAAGVSWLFRVDMTKAICPSNL